MGRLSLRLLGAFEGTLPDGTPLRLTSRKTCGLLAYLAVRGGGASRESLAALLWSDRPREQARRSLRQALYELRLALGDPAVEALAGDRFIAAIEVGDVDAVRFAQLAEAESEEPLAEAERLYRGPFLDGLQTDDAEFDTWLGAERARYHELTLSVLEALSRKRLASDQGEAALASAKRLIELDPYHEEGHRLAMRALAACGRRNQALTHYDRLKRILWDELRVAPVAETSSLRDLLRAAASPMEFASPGAAIPDPLTVAIRPFANLTGDPAVAYLATGLTADLVAALGRLPDLTVISLPDWSTNSREIDHNPTNHYIHGTVQKQADRIRITVQLTDVSGLQIWGSRYDRNAVDFLDLQDEIIRNILIAFEGNLTIGELARVDGRGTKSLDAWLLRVEAEAEVWKFTRDSTIRAGELYRAARDVDPTWSIPWGGLAWVAWQQAKERWAPSREAAVAEGMALAERAIELGPNEPMGYMQLGNLFQLQGAHERAVELRERAFQLAPSDFGAVCGFGSVLLRAGYTDRALVMLKRAARVAPRYPPSLCTVTALAHLIAGDSETALQMLRKATAMGFQHIGVHVVGAMALAELGRSEEAAEEISATLRSNPRYTVSDWIAAQDDFRDRTVISRLGGLLAQAGLPP